MPQAIAERIHAAPVAGGQNFSVLVQIRNVAERLVPQTACVQCPDSSLGVQFAVEAL